mgnify:CR=1 FL=1
MKFNYNKICIAAAIFSAAVACKPDFVDINTSASDTSHMSKMTVRILASGDMISTKTIADKDELTVKDFDIFVFSTTSTGNFLEWFSVGNLPEESSPIEGSCDFLIWSSEISVPTSGTKRIVAVGNSGKGMYPDMTIGKTSFDEFCKAFHFKAFEDKTNKTPFVMSGVTVVASSDGTTVPVRLSRQYNRLDVISGSPSVAITSVQVTKAPSVAYPFLNDYDRQPIPEFISYPVQEAGVPFYILYTPAGDPQWFVNIRVKGTLEGIPFDRTFICENPMYPDYNTVMELGVSDGELIAAYTPDYDSFQTRGAAMSYDIAAWLWTGLFANNDYAQAWASGNPVTSPEGATFTVTDMSTKTPVTVYKDNKFGIKANAKYVFKGEITVFSFSETSMCFIISE